MESSPLGSGLLLRKGTVLLSFHLRVSPLLRGLCQVIFVTLKLSGLLAFTSSKNAATVWHLPCFLPGLFPGVASGEVSSMN